MEEKLFTCNSIVELNDVALAIAKLLPEKGVITFYGEMGSGKTTLIKALCKSMNVIDNVSSPTFSIVNEYATQNGKCIYHFDFYRIKTISEVYDIGYENYFFGDGLCFVEWPEKIESLLKFPHTVITIEVKNELRLFKIITP